MSKEKYPTESHQSPEEMKMETFPGAFRSWANAWCMDRGSQPSRSNGSKPNSTSEARKSE